MSKLSAKAKEYVPTHSPDTVLKSPSGQKVAITTYDAYVPKATAEKMGYTEMGTMSAEEKKGLVATAKQYRAGRKRKMRKTAKKSRKLRRKH